MGAGERRFPENLAEVLRGVAPHARLAQESVRTMNSATSPPRLLSWHCPIVLLVGLSMIPWDAPISRWCSTVRIGGDIKRELQVVQQFGDLVSIVLTGTLIWLLDSGRRYVLWLGGGALACAGIVGTAAKSLIGRPRPKFGDPSFLGPWGTFNAPGFDGPRHAWEFWKKGWADLTSMPSSHTLFAAALAAFLALAYPRLRVLVVLLTALVGIARVVLGAHYPSEVFVGGALGWLAGSSGMLVVYRLQQSRQHVGTPTPHQPTPDVAERVS